MGWPGSIGVGVLTAATAALLAGWVTNLSVGWYRISSFEGKSGYFVIGMALLGLIGGLVIGIVTSRLVAAGTAPGFLKSLGLAQGFALGLIAVIGGTARLLADVPPRLDGEELLVAVEIRWPQGQPLPEETDTAGWRVRLGSSVRNTMRAQEIGPLWREDARQEEGRWIVPGAVGLFTSRGKRTIDVLPEGILDRGFLIPLPSRPGREFLEWSEWLPRARDGEPALAERYRYRFRVVPTSQPVRAEPVGAFEVLTIAAGFGEATFGTQPSTWYASGKLVVRHRGAPVRFEERDAEADSTARFEQVDVVAALAGPEPALLVQVDSRREDGPCHLVVSGPAGPAVTVIEHCGSPRHATPLTNDPARLAAVRERVLPEGRIDRGTFATPGLYHLTGVVLDTRTLTARQYPVADRSRLIERIPPLGVSPDGDSFVRLEFSEASDDALALVVLRLATGERYRLAVDAARMRYMDLDQIDPAWVSHHFAWQRDPAGHEVLVERAGFTPYAYRGSLTLDYSGYREYRIGPARAGLRAALIDFLVAEFQAERLPAEEGAYSHGVRIGTDTVHLSYREDDHHVGIWMDRGTDTRMVATIGDRFDAALRTGRYDHLFGR